MLVIGPDSLGLAQLQAHMNKQEYGELSSTMASSFKAAGAPISHYEVGRAKLVPSQCCTPCDLRTGMAPPIRSSLRRQTRSSVVILGPALCLRGEPLAVKHRYLVARSVAINSLQRCLCVSFASASASPAPSPAWIAAAALHFAWRGVRKEDVTAHLQRLDCQREEVRQSPGRLAHWLSKDKQIWGFHSFSQLND